MYSQLDPRWKDDTLGASPSKIGGWGCTMTCVAELSKYGDNSFTPKELAAFNDVFRKSDGAIYWAKAFEKIGGVKDWWREYNAHSTPSYDPTYQSVILQVEMDTSYGKHWVIDNGETILDPLGGVERPKNYYPIMGYTLITWDSKVADTSNYEGQLIQETEDSGTFAYVQDGKKRIIRSSKGDRAGLAALTLMCKNHLTVKAWDAIPTGEDF